MVIGVDWEVGTARANLAVSKEHPDGTTENGWASKHQHQTVSRKLQHTHPNPNNNMSRSCNNIATSSTETMTA
jgi:hypothetical protein